MCKVVCTSLHNRSSRAVLALWLGYPEQLPSLGNHLPAPMWWIVDSRVWDECVTPNELSWHEAWRTWWWSASRLGRKWSKYDPEYSNIYMHHHHHHPSFDRRDWSPPPCQTLYQAFAMMSGMVMFVHSMVLSVQFLCCRPHLRTQSKVPSLLDSLHRL